MTANIRVGTASWTDPTLIKSGKFYPKEVKTAEGRLRFYASKFSIVEVDSPYYALPSAKNSVLWAERTPPNFVFNMKAFRAMTHHQTPFDAFPPDLRALLPQGKKNLYPKDIPAEVTDEVWSRYLQSIAPLVEEGKLGAIHFQFPPWFLANRENRAYIESVRARLPRFTVAVEFRNRSWFADDAATAQTLAFEREHNLVNVIVDEPQGSKSSIPAVWEVTSSERAILRLHGRNHETWNAKGLTAASDRFNYDYDDAELASFVEPAKAVADHALNLDVIFNNNYEDQGQRNAAILAGKFADRAVGPELDLD